MEKRVNKWKMHRIKTLKFSYRVAKAFDFVFVIAIDAISAFPVIALFDASSFSFPTDPPGFVSSSLRVDPIFLNHKKSNLIMNCNYYVNKNFQGILRCSLIHKFSYPPTCRAIFFAATTLLIEFGFEFLKKQGVVMETSICYVKRLLRNYYIIMIRKLYLIS